MIKRGGLRGVVLVVGMSSSLKDESTEALRKRRDALDQMLMGLVQAGEPCPPELADEFQAVQQELAGRDDGGGDEAPLSWAGLLGRAVGDYRLLRRFGETPLSFTFLAGKDGGDERFLLKIARERFRPDDLSSLVRAEDMPVPTRAVPFSIGPIDPRPDWLLSCQASQLAMDRGAGLPELIDSGSFDGLPFYCLDATPLAEASSLRELLGAAGRSSSPGSSALAAVGKTAQALQELYQRGRLPYHGGVAPGSIYVLPEAAGGAVCLLEPGFFGSVSSHSPGGFVGECMVAPPRYYPLLVPDDLLALGIVLFEALFRFNPFNQGSAPDSGSSCLDSDVVDLVNFQRSLGNDYLLPLLQLDLERLDSSGLPAPVVASALKGLRLCRRGSSLIGLDGGFSDFLEFGRAVESIASTLASGERR